MITPIIDVAFAIAACAAATGLVYLVSGRSLPWLARGDAGTRKLQAWSQISIGMLLAAIAGGIASPERSAMHQVASLAVAVSFLLLLATCLRWYLHKRKHRYRRA